MPKEKSFRDLALAVVSSNPECNCGTRAREKAGVTVALSSGTWFRGEHGSGELLPVGPHFKQNNIVSTDAGRNLPTLTLCGKGSYLPLMTGLMMGLSSSLMCL